MMKRTHAALGVAAALLLMVGCAAEDVTDTAPSAEQSTTAPETSTPSSTEPEAADEPDGADEPAGEAAQEGTVTVDDVTYVINEVRSCDPYSDGPIERELELQGLGTAGGDRIQVNVYIGTVGDMPMNQVSWAGPEGVFGSVDNADVTIHQEGDRVYGSAIMRDALTQEGETHIDVDLNVPADTIACR